MIQSFEFHRHYKRYRNEIDAACQRVFERGWFILGPELKEFESRFAEYLGVKHVIGVASGTDALIIALKVNGIGIGDEVITVPNTAVPTVSAIRSTGAIPILVDVCETTHNLNPELLRQAINTRTRAIVPVHLYGYPARMDEIIAIANKYDLLVIEDVAQAHGARFDGQMLGTIGQAGCFSFYPTKNLGAFGDAGAVVTNDDDLAEKMRQFRNYGEIAKFQCPSEGVNSRLDELQAAFLTFGLGHLDEWTKRRADIAQLYFENLNGLPLGLPPLGNELESRVWHLFVIKTKEREALSKHLDANGVQTMIHYPFNIQQQEAYQFLKPAWELPVAESLAKEILTLPLYPELLEEEVLSICELVRTFYEKP